MKHFPLTNLARAVSAVIRNDAEYRRVEAEITKLLRKGENLTPEEERLLDLLSALVERYEDESEDFPASPPHRILQFLMEQNDLQQTDLVKIFGIIKERLGRDIRVVDLFRRPTISLLAEYLNQGDDGRALERIEAEAAKRRRARLSRRQRRADEVER